MIIWSGWGILSVVFAVVGIVVGGIAGAAGGALVGGVVGGGAAAVLNHFVAKALGTGKIMIDPATNQQVMLKKSNSLFFIPMSWFTVIFATAGILIRRLPNLFSMISRNFSNWYMIYVPTFPS